MIKMQLREIMLRREIEYQEPYSISAIAKAADVSLDTVSRWRRDVPQRIDRKVLGELCRVLDVTPGELLIYVPDGPEEEATTE